MLCSKCSDEIKPIVVCDIDGTLGDYHQHFHDFAEKYEQRQLNPGYDGSMELHEWYGMDLEHYRTIKLAYRQGGMKRSMPVMYAAKRFVTFTRAQGCELWLTTTRPFLRLDNIDPDTRFWLQQAGIRYDGLMYDENKYELLATRIDPARVIAVIEDLPEQYWVASRVFGENVPILMRAQHNIYAREQEDTEDRMPEYTTAENLFEALDLVTDRLTSWVSRMHA